ncbi:quinolinate synthase NadA [Nitratidesulfovibrio vulgaris]|uniref:quinolinate synthase n=2 Tax=Nitratidesulfovibrio vulgaris TaxID=881 RepID=Q72B30_NITV2|nr:quinolinate synthase NadA [Nitratidesulfovibrio vulgaris]AAS96285.1 quinolinate synthetase complex, subunit A [Nitratidesulfovibrio vulgaris str. Hildenborough]ABM28370.1 quinolinate synthetase A [Nitratidesulfovibrio vulgaris DP4]ADP86650.1 quinolinate synthetase complex, A subunit [Nitratidesulfovibrio vulgaris RCH1]GEB79468.1 quinolinate synthetase [Desulfovibrio desulfuricans]
MTLHRPTPASSGETPQDVARRIDALRGQLGDDVLVMGHHYQHDSVIRHTDLRGDSLELARKVDAISAKHIVFCGVYFMAESAALLARDGQSVHIPESDANCVMSQMAPAQRVDAVLRNLSGTGRNVIPLAYVNTSLAVKAVVGRHGGAVCTSANAKTMLTWARERADAVVFLPDKNLARNTADLLGIAEDRRHILDIRDGGAAVDMDAASGAELLMWPGCCAIHARFNLRQMERMRDEHPGCRIAVHPECSPEVVRAADAAGSTSFLIRYAEEQKPGTTLVIGTEINLVERLAAQHAGRITVLPLLESGCSHMARVTAPKLLATLESIASGTASPVAIPLDLQDDAHAALQRMLEACA